jgi:hypothetical protein
MRTIQSPGVEISEIDLSLRPSLPVGTNVLIPGFSQKGPTEEVIEITTLSEFEQVYGTPTNAAERYFYHTVKAVKSSPANTYIYRLPYGQDAGDVSDKFSALVYPIIPLSGSYDPTVSNHTSFYEAGATSLTAVNPTLDTDGPVKASVVGSTTVVGSNLPNVGDTTISVVDTLNFELGNANITDILTSVTTVINIIGIDPVGKTITIAAPLAAAYPAWSTIVSQVPVPVPVIGGIKWRDGAAYYIGEPQNYYITAKEYDDFKQGTYSWSTSSFDETNDRSPFTDFKDAVEGGAGLVIVNSRKNIINEKFEGFYVGLIDNTNLNPATDFDGCLSVNTVTKKLSGSNPDEDGSAPIDRYLSIPDTRLNFALSSTDRPTLLPEGTTGASHSVSEVLENLSDIDLGTAEFDDTIAIGLFKIRQSVMAADTTKLDFILSESYVGSLNAYKTANSPTGGTPQSHFIEDVASAKVGTPNIEIFVNPHISQQQGDWFDHELAASRKKVRVHSTKPLIDQGIYLDTTEQAATSGFRSVLDDSASPTKQTLTPGNKLYPCGVFKDTSLRTLKVGAIPSKLERMFEVLDNYELYPLDLTVEAGLGTVYVGTSGGRTEGFDDEAPWSIDEDGGRDDLYQTKVVSNWKSADEGGSVMNYRFVNDAFINFAATRRKDILHISDNLRYIFVQGKNSKVLDQEFVDKDAIIPGTVTKKYFSKHVYWPLRHIQGNANTSYSCAFGNWAKVYDSSLNRGVWAPFSGFAAALMGNTDANFQPWYAPAGFTRGILNNVSDLAIYPKVKERDQLYKINQNPVANFPNDGFVVFGQKTLQKKPSAFDRINVRRLFLYLEKATRATVKYFVFEPNTLFTRTQVVNVLTPIFENAKNTEGMYDYLIVCDERNNTPDVIDQNEMVIDIYIKPVRAAEFILVNFYATRTGQDFNELIG